MSDYVLEPWELELLRNHNIPKITLATGSEPESEVPARENPVEKNSGIKTNSPEKLPKKIIEIPVIIKSGNSTAIFVFTEHRNIQIGAEMVYLNDEAAEHLILALQYRQAYRKQQGLISHDS